MSELLEPYVSAPTIRSTSRLSLFCFSAALLVGAIINFIMSQLVSKTGLSGTDKALGVAFGGARGVLIVTLLPCCSQSLTPMPDTQWWQDSAMVGFFQQLGEWVKGIIPGGCSG